MHWSRVSLFVVVGLAYVAGVVYVAQPQNSAPPQPKMPENRLVTGTRHFPNRIDLNRTKK